MKKESTHQFVEQDLMRLEAKVETLLRAYGALRKENQLLREREQELLNERTRLMDKSEIARARIESIIGRLKAMEESRS